MSRVQHKTLFYSEITGWLGQQTQQANEAYPRYVEERRAFAGQSGAIAAERVFYDEL